MLLMCAVIGTICGVIMQRIAEDKGRDPHLWFFIGLVFGLLGLWVALVMDTPTDRKEVVNGSKSSLHFDPLCPIVLLSYDLIKNADENIGIICRLKNNVGKTVEAVMMDIKCYGIDEEEFTEVEKYTYLDLKVYQYQTFGTDREIKIPDKRSRQFKFVIKKVLFDDGTWWINESNEALEVFSYSLEPISHLNELVDQYNKELDIIVNPMHYRKHYYLPKAFLEFQICGCGNVLSIDEKTCGSCQVEINELLRISDVQYLYNKMPSGDFQE